VTGQDGTLEKHVTLDLARRLAQRLGGPVVLTRGGDTNLSLADRSAIARNNQAAVFLSLHASGGLAAGRGAEVFHHSRGNGRARALAGSLTSGLLGRGHSASQRSGDLAVLAPDSHSDDTAACLVEIDYLANPDTVRRLRDPRELDRLADGLAYGVNAYLGRLGGAAPAMDRAQTVPAAVPIAGLAVATFSLINTLAHQTSGSLTWSRNITAAIHSYPENVTANAWQSVSVPILGVDASHNAILSSAWARFDVEWRCNGNDIDQCRVTCRDSSDWSRSTLSVSFEGSDAASYETDSVACIAMYIRGTFDPAGSGDVDFEGTVHIKGDGTTERQGMRLTRGDGVTVWTGSMEWSEREIPFTGGTQGEWGNNVGGSGYMLQKQ
jgi:hypothetical protein